MKSINAVDLASTIEKRSEFIVRAWLSKVREQIPISTKSADEIVTDSLPKYLGELADALRFPEQKTSLNHSFEMAREHGKSRVPLKYEVGDVATEYAILREILIEEASKEGSLSIETQAELSRISDAGLVNAIEEFLENTVIKNERAARQVEEFSEKSLEDFFMQAPDPMVIMKGPEHIFTVANRPYVELIGQNPVGRSVREVFTSPEAERFFSLLDQVYETGIPYVGKEIPYRQPLPDDKFDDRWISIAYYPARDPSGEINGIHAIVHDVTSQVNARKLAEEGKNAVEQQTKNFENLFAETPEMVCILQGPEHKFRFVNSAHIKMLGFDATGMTIREAQPESTELYGILDNVFSTGKTAELFEIPVTLSERRRFFNLTFAAKRGPDGQVDGVMALGAEVTEEVSSREALILQGKALKLSMSEAPLAEVLEVITKQVEMQTGNTLIASILLADKDEEHLLHGAAPGLPEAYNRAVNGMSIGPLIGSCGAAAHSRKRVVVTDITTDPRWADFKNFATSFGLHACWSIPIISSEDRLLGTFAFYARTPRAPTKHEIEIASVAAQTTALIIERRNEIEDRANAAHEAERANEAKSAFLANMSHEIRTPLGAIMGFSDLAKQPDATREEVESYLGVIERNSAQVLRVIDDILDLAKVEAGRVDIEAMETHLPEFLADFTSLVEYRAHENGISFNIVAETDLPSAVCTDPTRLRQILTNSVGNAIKFTTKGSVTLHVYFENELLKFKVRDTGRGISEAQSKKLFQAFVQADTSTTRKFGGTGLGLVLTKRLCKLMGGDYVLSESEIGKGSTFTASIQARPSSGSKMIPKSEVIFEVPKVPMAVTAKGRLDGVSVLLVEDSPDNQVLVQLILERQGAKLTIATDGETGVEKALKDSFDVVLMDIQMPRMDGHEAIRQLREKGYDRPVVALTAHAMREEAERARRSGFSKFLSKPIQREALIGLVGDLAHPNH